MIRYFIRRLLVALPTLWVVSIFIFGLSRCSDVDQVVLVLGEDTAAKGVHPLVLAKRYQEKAAQLNTDGPLFYVSMHAAAFPDTLHRIYPPSRRQRLTDWCYQTGNWPAVQGFDQSILAFETALQSVPDSLGVKESLKQALTNFQIIKDLPALDTALNHVRRSGLGIPSVQSAINDLTLSVQALKFTQKAWLFVPSFQWNGFNNQYHKWISRFVMGDWGRSFYTKKLVWDELKYPMIYSLIVNILTIFFSFVIALPIGMEMARRKDKRFDQWTKQVMLILFVIPSFIVGAMLILLFATPGIGLYWLGGIKIEPFEISDRSFMEWFMTSIPQFILPVITMTLPTVVYLCLMMRGSVLETLSQDYIRTARSKGLKEDAVYEKHAYRNALFPIITLFAGVFPGVFMGSLTVEYLFSYPGLGMKMQSAFMSKDHPVLFAILMIAALLTIIGNIVSDILYTYVNPTVKL